MMMNYANLREECQGRPVNIPGESKKVLMTWYFTYSLKEFKKELESKSELSNQLQCWTKGQGTYRA